MHITSSMSAPHTLYFLSCSLSIALACASSVRSCLDLCCAATASASACGAHYIVIMIAISTHSDDLTVIRQADLCIASMQAVHDADAVIEKHSDTYCWHCSPLLLLKFKL
jgi:hypothetical protein